MFDIIDKSPEEKECGITINISHVEMEISELLAERATGQPLLMPIEDIFTITGRGTVVTGVVYLPESTEMVMPGDNVEMPVELIQPVAMDEGLRSPGQRGYCL
ncbi:hypothetical protein NLL38_11615 [Corynebacterium accolens]|uniref:hypothetical protein n=1 Tax=Corynebacterium accolens TaxID=38284 RepID=UPI003F57B102|nr:hypothetical protein NLL38_11615 [Corynebacterium accolens]WKS74834.1 hypothetical protein NLL44_11640 [Corynebacterium accolens]